MKTWVFTLVTITIGINEPISAGDHRAAFKSIRSTDVECQQYLNGSINGKCAVRCRGQIDRFWEDSTGLKYSVKRLYRPDPEDGCFRNRTDRCLKRTMETVPKHDQCQLAQEAVQCYNDQYGELNVDDLQFIPLTPLQLSQMLMDCASILGISESQLKAVAQAGIGSIPEGACLLRCFLLRQGLYTDEGGFSWQRIDAQCGGYGGRREQSVVQQCVYDIPECDICVKALRATAECLKATFRVTFEEIQGVKEIMPFSVKFYANGAIGADIGVAGLGVSVFVFNGRR